MPELRRDPVTKKWTILSKERAQRPEAFHRDKSVLLELEEEKKEDPFAEGKEHLNTPELLAYSKDPKRKADTPGWTVRVFENKYPAFDFVPGDKLEIYKEGMYEYERGVGYHEVIVTVDPKKHLALFSGEEMAELVRAYQERFSTHCAKRIVNYVCIIYNYGPRAGGTVAHPHSQLFAFPIITNNVWDEINGAEDYYKKNRRCVFCDMVKEEKHRKTRVLIETENFISFMPYAARVPFETWIMPKHHEPYFEHINKDQRFEFGDHLREVLNKLSVKFNDPPYNFYIHSSPCDAKEYPHYHWHLELMPRFTRIGGFELGTGMMVNIMPPEDAAKYIRSVR